MVKAGFPDSTILKVIEASDTAFETSVSALQALKDAGATPEVVAAVLKSGTTKQSPAVDQVRDRVAPGPPASSSGRYSGMPAIYVEEVSSSGGVMASSDTTLEGIKTLQKSGMRVVTVKEKADYVLQVTRQLGKHSWKKDTKVVLSNREGEVVFSNSTRSVGGAMGDVADFVKKHNE